MLKNTRTLMINYIEKKSTKKFNKNNFFYEVRLYTFDKNTFYTYKMLTFIQGGSTIYGIGLFFQLLNA